MGCRRPMWPTTRGADPRRCDGSRCRQGLHGDVGGGHRPPLRRVAAHVLRPVPRQALGVLRLLRRDRRAGPTATTQAFASTDDRPEQVRAKSPPPCSASWPPASLRANGLSWRWRWPGPTACAGWRRASPASRHCSCRARRWPSTPVPAEVPHAVGSGDRRARAPPRRSDDVASVSRSLPAAVYLCLVPTCPAPRLDGVAGGGLEIRRRRRRAAGLAAAGPGRSSRSWCDHRG